ncbi:MAG: SGNH/GDSL hydrolase family protein [Pseudomonadota bacterium]
MSARRVLAYGDSNTHGTVPMADHHDRRRFDKGVRWPGVMASALGTAWDVIEEGHPGRTTVHDDPVEGAHKNGLSFLPVALETHRPLDLVIVMLGTNDLKARFAVEPFDIARSCDRLVGLVQGSDAGPGHAAPGVLLVAPFPIEETGTLAAPFKGGASKSRDLAAHMASVAHHRGVGFMDAGQHVSADPLDGIHLSADSHKALGAAVAEAVRARFPD